MIDKSVRRQAMCIKSVIFFLVLYAFMIFSMLLPMRPKVSLAEKRELARFPAFSFSSLLSGTYFDGITTWFADTFPEKDFLVSVSAKVRSCFGFGDKIHGTVEAGDEIPDAPYQSPSEAEETE